MALRLREQYSDEIPEGAVPLSKDEALRYEIGIIRDWSSASEVFCLRWAPGVCGGMAMISSFLINNHFRYKLKLGKYGRLSSYLSVVMTPVLISSLLHTTAIQAPIILRTYNCPICLETRGAIIQGACGVLYPFVLAPVAAFMFATRHFTYRLPSVTTQGKDLLKLYLKFSKSARTMGSVLLAINVLMGMLLTNREIQEHNNIGSQLSEYEKKYDSGLLSDHEMKI